MLSFISCDFFLRGRFKSLYIIYKHCCFYHEVGGTFLSPNCVFLVQQMRGEKLFYEVIYEAVFLTSLKFYYFGPSFKRKCHQIQYQLPVAKAFAINIFYISICSTVHLQTNSKQIYDSSYTI